MNELSRMAEWERGTVVSSDQWRALIVLLHRVFDAGEPTRVEINFDGKNIGPVRYTRTETLDVGEGLTSRAKSC